jgi:hypothetical protein
MVSRRMETFLSGKGEANQGVISMRDLRIDELDQVYGAGGKCGSKGRSGSPKSKSHKSRSNKSRSHKSGSHCR